MPRWPLSGRHFFARFRAVFTGAGAFLTVVVIVFSAFFTAFAANFRTQLTQLFRLFALQRHKLCGQAAKIGALHIQTNAVAHHIDVLFFQAGSGAAIAGRRTEIAGFDTALISFGHGISSRMACAVSLEEKKRLCKKGKTLSSARQSQA